MNKNSPSLNPFYFFIDYIDELIIISDLEGQILHINHSVEKMVYPKKTDITGKSLNSLMNIFNVKLFKTNSLDELLKRLPIIKLKRKCIINKEETHIIWTLLPMIMEGKHNPEGIILIGKDITKLKQLSGDVARLDNIIQYAPDWIYWKDKNSVHLGCNEQFAKVAGFPSHFAMIGKSDDDFPWHDRAYKYRIDDKEVMKSGKPKLNIEDKVLIHDGTEVTVISNKVPLRNESGKIIGVLGIATNITYLKAIEKKLQKAKLAAEAASQAKTEFLANMSHDIRTPLAGVIGMSHALENNLENPERKEEAHLLSQSGSQLLNMLTEILDDIRANNTSELKVQEETFDLYQCIQGLVELETPTVKTNHLELKYEIDNNVPRYIISDRKKIHHVILNLLGNAVKFTKTGNVTIQVKCLDSTKSRVHLQFGVADTGIGIPEKLQKKVFERFFRVDPSYKGRYEGYGLGLNIVQSYVSLLGGHITLTSKEGVGTTFHFDLQCKIGHKKDSKLETLPVITLQQKPSVTRDYPAQSNTAHVDENAPHILLVEDNYIALQVLKKMVEACSALTYEALDAESAFALVKSQPFDLIITDLGLPGQSGDELARAIRHWETENHKNHVPIIGLTGHASEEVAQVCLDAGMNQVYTKPMEEGLLKKIIEGLINLGNVE